MISANASLDKSDHEEVRRANARSVSLSGICKSYGNFSALKPISIDLKAGELLSLLGPSGCGKTTTLRIVAGFVAPDQGSIRIGGQDVTNIGPNARGLGMVFQSYSLFPHMTVADNVGFGLKMHGVPRRVRTERVNEALAMVRLESLAGRYPKEMSGGQQQRVALARALITQPSVLLLDEPLGALDRNLRERMQTEIRQLQRRLGITTILVTHDQEEAMIMSDRIAVMSQGSLVQVGTPEEVYEFPKTKFVSEFLGTSNLFSATVLDIQPNSVAVLKLQDGGPQVKAKYSSERPPSKGDRVTVAVRPERVQITSDGSGLPATLREVVYRGTSRSYELTLQGRESTVTMTSPLLLPIRPGDPVNISWDGHAVVLVDGENE